MGVMLYGTFSYIPWEIQQFHFYFEMFSQNSIKWENSADINTRFDITTKLRVLWNICLVMPRCSEENSATPFWNYQNLDNNKKKKYFNSIQS